MGTVIASALAGQLASLPKLGLRFFIDVGARETGGTLGGSAPPQGR